MKMFTTLALSTALLMSQAAFATGNDGATVSASANPSTIDVYTVNYVESVDSISRQTQHALQYLTYQGQMDIYHQARRTILEIGAQMHQLDGQLAQSGKNSTMGENWSRADNAAK